MYLVSVGSGVSIVSVYVSGLVGSWLCVSIGRFVNSSCTG